MLLRRAAAEKRTQPRVIMERVLPQLQMQLVGQSRGQPVLRTLPAVPGRDAASRTASA